MLDQLQHYDLETQQELIWAYGAETKALPYVGNPTYLKNYPNRRSRQFYNSLAVFPDARPTREHGILGRFPNNSFAYVPQPMPPPIVPETAEKLLENGGFYMALSDALPLDRDPQDARPAVCRNIVYDLASLEDTSVIITFYNEPISTLMRSVHSVLNRTPPPLLREILLVDDHSNLTDLMPGGFLYKYIELLPKVKVVRLPERRGLVTARLAGARSAAAPILVVLDSHIEVNDGWLEPQLERLKTSPKSIVFPQIPSVNSENFSWEVTHGIGCRISFKWVMQELSQGVIIPDDPASISSPSMAGGLFAVRADWFWELGGYDEEFSMWGAENVEMGFRTWMCGGRVECAPCGYVYHIYRKSGKGYSSPPAALSKNRLRTARLWTDHFYQLAKLFIHPLDADIGSLDTMLALKERLQCKNFTWFLDNVDQIQPLRKITRVPLLGQIRNAHATWMCVDTLANSKTGKPYGGFHCHDGGGTQGFLYDTDSNMMVTFMDESVCLSPNFVLSSCSDMRTGNGKWFLDDTKRLRWSNGTDYCLSVNKSDEPHERLKWESCDQDDKALQWDYEPFVPDPNFALPTYSDTYKTQHQHT